MDIFTIMVIGAAIGLLAGVQMLQTRPPQAIVIQVEREEAPAGGCLSFIAMVVFMVLIVALFVSYAGH